MPARANSGGARIAQTAALGLCAKNQKTRGAPARGIELAETAAELSRDKKTCLFKNVSARPARSRARAA